MAQLTFANGAGAGIPISDSYQDAAISMFTMTTADNHLLFTCTPTGAQGPYSAGYEKAGSNVFLRIKHDGNSWAYDGPYSVPRTVGIACYRVTSGGDDGYKIIAVIGADEETVANLIHSGGFNIYSEVISFISESDAEDDGLIVLDREWDEEPTDDPSDPNNENPSGGGYADTDEFGLTDDMLVSGLPDGSDLEIDTGSFLCQYVLDSGEMSGLGTKLFATTFWQSLANRFSGLSDPLRFIISANVMPFLVYDEGQSREMKLGGVTVETGHSVKYNTTRFVQFSFGSLVLKETWGTDKDYSATSIDIFLPYSGVHSLDVDAIMQTTLTLKCNVDLWTGDMVWLLHSSNADMSKKFYKQENVIYRFTGNCATSLPLGTVDPSGPIIRGFSSLAGMAAGFAIGGPAGAALGGMAAKGAGGAQAQQTAAPTGAEASTSTLNVAGAALAGAGAAASILNMNFTPLGGAGNGVSGSTGFLDYQFPYLIIKRGVPAYPNNWRQEFGAPRYQEFTISSLHGYTEFAEVHADDVDGATDAEKQFIEQQLMQGVILP